ncbi:hypothetical protein AJ85_01420 [Alkalihalobacillus alcalophilus ATCC 27647 = CGMCC 1.3604]|uniref:Uncharacterized protein n=1 Tax=Alkalihalobacillus alcalophilus ATCC 27647 = CGMCC 1.3604 TaxID=1218173 RepID=A0A094WHC5_ALKAL|nr:hypothetical protein [Alkalihalobacillus alcalophilus]KGA97184.1 hypothetical protein BALCAV_0211760 [Alkalihalobacillus alcalophilus ATCC 27647 = CGMCC 1.3604]MED1560883.1 hypothetical protein [Alkalihalobacillus alcalophilus]THG91831.1 hypothetical protein AJ85_01420 [Alkalihalobacillus alcalophilus ATCC 27647 = CGMCC 1.3604]
MYQSTERIQELLNACEQILNHMEVNESQNMLLEKIKQQLKRSNQQFQYEGNDTGAYKQLQHSVHELSYGLEKLQESVFQDYQSYTNNSIDDFEALSYKEQMNYANIYHAKIDYYSTTKLLQNLEKVNSELMQLL